MNRQTSSDEQEIIRQGATLNVIRGTKGISVEGLAQELGVSSAHLYNMQAGRKRLTPELVAQNNAKMNLVGKAADILVTDSEVTRLPGVETAEILVNAQMCLEDGRCSQPSLTVVNVQQTDLAGHQQDAARYVSIIEQFDVWLGGILWSLQSGDVLIITADHGNDPLIGHAFHTREFVPCLVATKSDEGKGTVAVRGSDYGSLADIGASCAELLGIAPGLIGHGTPQDLFN